AHGASASDAFHVVIPSMAGYGFSGKPTTPGWDPARMARAWVELMKRLGYSRFAAQGGDWGGFVTNAMAQQAPPELIGIHVNFTLSWLTNTGVSCARLYREYKGAFFNDFNISVPAAVSVFPEEVYQAPRSWTERAYHNLIHFNALAKGGHFAAWEQPQLFSEEVRAGFRSLRTREAAHDAGRNFTWEGSRDALR